MGDMSHEELDAHLRNPFTKKEHQAWIIAHRLILQLEVEPIIGMRCHEIARAMGRVLRMEVCDGHVGVRFRDLENPTHFRIPGIQHSWLWTVPFPANVLSNEFSVWKGSILDPWSMGGYPRVQLHSGQLRLGNLGVKYHPGEPRTDINDALTNQLERFFEEKLVELSKK